MVGVYKLGGVYGRCVSTRGMCIEGMVGWVCMQVCVYVQWECVPGGCVQGTCRWVHKGRV